MNAPHLSPTLAAAAPLGELGLSFVALGPGPDGAWAGSAVPLGAGAAAGLAEIAEVTRAAVRDAVPLPYSAAGVVAPGHVMHVASAQAATLTAIQSVIDVGDLDSFDPAGASAHTIKMVAARFRGPEGPALTFYRVADSLLQFRTRRVFSLVRQGGRYERLEPADVLIMRPEFDVVVADEHAWFFRKTAFERAFGFLEELQRESVATFERVSARLRVEGLAAWRAACTTQPPMMAKLASIQRSLDEDPAYAASMTMPRLLRYVDANPELGIPTSGHGAQRRLVFDPSPTQRWRLLHLLDDDYLHSVLTDRHYEALAKQRAPSG